MTEHLRLANSVIYEQFGDETVIVRLDTGRYYNLQGSAEAIWALAASGLSRRQIREGVSAAFSGEPAEIAKATTDFLDELLAEELLERAEGDASADAKPPAVAGGPFVKPHLQKYTDMEELLQLDPIHQVDELGWPNAKTPGA